MVVEGSRGASVFGWHDVAEMRATLLVDPAVDHRRLGRHGQAEQKASGDKSV
jgi:hypothetical protein